MDGFLTLRAKLQVVMRPPEEGGKERAGSLRDYSSCVKLRKRSACEGWRSLRNALASI